MNLDRDTVGETPGLRLSTVTCTAVDERGNTSLKAPLGRGRDAPVTND
jgi:hypothetical protein